MSHSTARKEKDKKKDTRSRVNLTGKIESHTLGRKEEGRQIIIT
jgi:hypothetical protein